MKETLQITASILSIIGVIIAFLRWVLNPYLRKREDLKRLNAVITERYNLWEEQHCFAHKENLISPDNFININKYRNKFENKSEEVKAYLIRNAIQHGRTGNWGFWLDMVKDNKYIINPLFLALDKELQIRTAWRSAYILEKIFSQSIHKINQYIAESKIDAVKCKQTLDSIKNRSVKEEIIKLSKQGTKDERDKLKYVINEINIYTKEINTFTQEQTIIN